MPRIARQIYEGISYHIISRGNNRLWLFNDEGDFNHYLTLTKKYKEKYNLKIYHWVLMNNHIHMILDGDNITKAMHGINLCYAQWFHKKNNSSGHIWEDRFKSFAIEKETYLLECGRYIERNPVRAGISEDPGEYRWSSYNVYTRGTNDEITDINELFESLGQSEEERRKAYKKYVSSMRMKEERKLLKEMKKGYIGSDAFADKLERLSIDKIKKSRKGRILNVTY